uniref:starch synthase n=1 Tax=Tetraselmis sp. GSL018 TaxID=582737 RepID=A0A061R363_9CHLO|eukprot:CAMPEP_0177606094 /NCGR_PEP_ID=MMETSP0419_2-20121207/17104_1 /TAXON_ID=582737 /ORGANISM="Tetraselmis sp., Strain GSL018" /LENGTH=592 /DNA_ID=CAMNT_0019100393 /DNA_START=113 /DNA_END=1891 /DNA_ORIENTATION=+
MISLNLKTVSVKTNVTSPPSQSLVPRYPRPSIATLPFSSDGKATLTSVPRHRSRILAAEVQELETSEIEIDDFSVGADAEESGGEKHSIVFVASEVAPWSKTGGLADVMNSLPSSLSRRGHRVMVIAPRYGQYEDAVDTGIKANIWLWGSTHEVGFYHCYKNGVDFVFVDHPGSFLRMGTPYGDANGEFGDNQFRFTLLSYAALEAPLQIPLGGFPYGDEVVFVANDWHTALIPTVLAAKYRSAGVYLGARSVLAIHNLFHQGCFPPDTFNQLGLDGRWYNSMGWQFMERAHMACYSYGHAVNYMKAGLVNADRVVTVSPGYAYEIATPEGGWGMDGIIRERQYVLNGILNGIEPSEWSPQEDVHIAQNYDEDTFEEGKAACKAALQESMGLPVRPEVPLIGFVGRLDDQKGADLILGAMEWLASQDVQVVLLGTGRKDLEDGFKWAESSFRDKVRAYVGFNVAVSHQITAGADLLMMPSRFEPCGLNQLYAMAYGTPVIAHETGGLKDTVLDVAYHDSIGSRAGTGWTFQNADVAGLKHALGMALHCFWNDKERFRDVQLTAMRRDSTWETAAANYEQIFAWAKIDLPVTG